MSDGQDDDELFRRLTRLVASAKTIPQADRRMILSLECDLQILRTALVVRRDVLSAKLQTAGAGNRAMSAYSRVATLAARRTSRK